MLLIAGLKMEGFVRWRGIKSKGPYYATGFITSGTDLFATVFRVFTWKAIIQKCNSVGGVWTVIASKSHIVIDR